MEPSLTFVFLKAFLIGLSVAAPVGPMGLLCIRRTLQSGWLSGYLSGLAVAFGDAFYASVAVFSVAAIAQFLTEWQSLLRIVGGLVLLLIGWKTFISRPESIGGVKAKRLTPATFVSTFMLTLTNPATVIYFTAIFASMGIVATKGFGEALAAVIGIFLGSMTWYVVLSGGVNLARSRVTTKSMVWINRISGTMLATFGILAIITLKS